jgi:3-oxoadipate enol-lactonase
MPTLAVNGIELYYEVHGGGPPIVFAHGAGGNHLSWWQQVPNFRDRFRCVTFDHRGFGRSVDRPDGPGAAAFVDDLAALIDHLELERVRLVAQSMGGWTCLGYALAHPERVAALVMADTHGGLSTPELEAARERARERTADLPQELAARAIGPTFKATNPAGAFLYSQIWGLNPPRGEATTAHLRDHRVSAAQVAGLRLPALFIVGDEDVLIPPEVIRLAATLVPGARYELVAGAGHSVYFERPDVFNALVDKFLRGG